MEERARRVQPLLGPSCLAQPKLIEFGHGRGALMLRSERLSDVCRKCQAHRPTGSVVLLYFHLKMRHLYELLRHEGRDETSRVKRQECLLLNTASIRLPLPPK